ncbi:MAG: PstS family phosphate ABC transporter substrate-binding protein [Chromatiales bacterium]|jgi:phosphate transport system substrate-binding protein|nr:PstS family phosphate ABC transporter substrate-binding protein [Chromatiales bacterium]
MKAAIAATTLVALCVSVGVGARDYINVVGSSTVYPFSTTVAEQFGKSTDFRTPKVESTGSGGGLKLFCAGVGIQHPDVTNASRRIKRSEVKMCERNGVDKVIEVKVGYDGIVIASAKAGKRMALTRKDIFLALAKWVPAGNGTELEENTAKTWRDVNPALPATKIEVLGPPPTSGTRDAFAELGLEGGCEKIPFIKAIKKTDTRRYKEVCHSVREDQVYVETGENDNLIVQKLQANPKALGIFGFSFLDQNADKVQGALVDGMEPTFENIADGKYPISRPLYVYVKTAHIGVIPGIEEYLVEFTAEKAVGEDGYLTDKGLIPMPDEERQAFAKAAANKTNLVLE